MDKNSIIGFVLIGLILLGFSFFQTREAKERAKQQAQLDSIALAQRIASGEIDTAGTTISISESTLPSDENASGSASSKVFKDSTLAESYNGEASFPVLENDKLCLTFTTRGAQPYSARVKDYYNHDSTDLYIFKPENCELNLNVYTGEYIRTKDFNFQIVEHSDSVLVMRLPFDGGRYIEQRWILPEDSYQVKNLVSFVGEGLIPRNVSSFDIDFKITVPRMEKGYKNEVQYSKLNYYYSGDKKPEEIGRGRNGSKRLQSFDWFACQQQFFSAIMRAPDRFASGDLDISF